MSAGHKEIKALESKGRKWCLKENVRHELHREMEGDETEMLVWDMLLKSLIC